MSLPTMSSYYVPSASVLAGAAAAVAAAAAAEAAAEIDTTHTYIYRELSHMLSDSDRLENTTIHLRLMMLQS